MGGWTGMGYDAISVGQTWLPQVMRIGMAQLDRYFLCIGRTDKPTSATPVPAFMLNELRVLKSNMKLPPGVLHAQEELMLSASALAEEDLTIEVTIQDKYVRNDKRFVVVAQTVRRMADATLILQVRHTLYWPC